MMQQITVLIKKASLLGRVAIAVAAMALACGGRVAYAEGADPATPAPTATPMTIHGIACVDQDLNGICSFEEARVPNVLVRTVADSAIVGVTDNAGEYTLRASPQSALEVTIPSGFKSVNGNLHKLRIQMDQSDQVDIALAMDVPYSVTAPISMTVAGSTQGNVVVPALTVMGLDVNPFFVLLAVLVAVLALLCVVLLVLLRGIRRADPKPVMQQETSLLNQTDPQLRAQEATFGTWQMVAEQMVADALGETVSIDESVGILDAKAEPNPRFSLVTRDGRTIIFTTDVRLLRKAKIIRRGDRVVDISARSAQNHASAGALWHQVLAIRNMWHITPPSKAHWYVVERGKGKKVSKVRGQSISEMPFLRIPQMTHEEHV
jgi:hypothetical protein